MRKFLVAVIMLLALVVPVAAKADKVTICHVPPGNPENAHTITISENALKAHLGENEEGLHGGDYRGECITDTTVMPTPTPTPVVEPTPTPIGDDAGSPIIPNTAMPSQ